MYRVRLDQGLDLGQSVGLAARLWASERARCAKAVPSASLPGTLTLCWSRTSKRAGAQRFQSRGVCLRISVFTRNFPVLRRAVGGEGGQLFCQQFQHGRVVKVLADDPFQGGVDVAG